jgi:TonB-linked SusC/RagA family outer membrane protein
MKFKFLRIPYLIKNEAVTGIIRIMKISFIFLFIFSFQLLALNTKAQDAVIELKTNSMTVGQLINEIEKQTDYLVVYSNREVDANRKVDVQRKSDKVSSYLNEAFEGTDIGYDFENNYIVLMKKANRNAAAIAEMIRSVQQQGKTITGKVVDVNGEPIIGANIIEVGTTNGTVTDIDGNFSLKVADNATIRISYIGYLEQEINTAGKTSFNITLVEDTQALEEVVVVGYGVQKKVNLTGSVASVKYDKELENRPITDASQALSGKIPGVWVSQNSGSPGSDGATIRIRGYGTLNNTNPLILIDGIEGRLAEINPNDIESISVLKDAASAAIYGSKAANGVILIETKKGTGIEKISLNYNGYIGMQQLGRRYDIISNSAEYMEIWNAAVVNSGGDPLFPQDVINAFKTGNDPYKYPNTNYFDEVFRNALTTQHNLSATISNKTSNTYVSINYLKQDGIVKNTDANRYGITVNNSTKINNFLDIGARIRYTRKISRQPYDGIGRVIYMMANGHPFSTPYLQDGKTFGGTQALYLSGPKAGQPIVDTRNPFPDLYNGENTYTNNFVKGNFFATLKLLEGLNLTAQYNGQYNNNLRDRYNELHFCYTDLEYHNQTKPLDYPSTLNRYRSSNDEYYSTFFTNINFDKTFNEIHEVSGVIGFQSESLDYRPMEAQKSDPPKEELHQVSSGTSNPIANGNKYSWRMLSYFGRINYALYSKYLFEANIRADGSSRFAKDNRWGYFPSFSAAWRLSEEPFVEKFGIFDNFKIRASWGKLGNQNIGEGSNMYYFPYLKVIDQSYATSYNFGNQLAPGAAITTLTDPNITWETTTTTDIGVDLGFLRNRLTIESDYFVKNTSDIIVQLPIPLTMGGLNPPFENVGKMSNKGFEININWNDRIQQSKLSYNLGTNLTYVKNRVDKFRGGKSPDQLYLIREGYSYKTLYGYIQEGVYQTNKEAAEHMKNNGYIPVAGDLRYKDFNNDGRLDYHDKREIGNTIPKFVYGINGSVTWKNFDLSFLFTGIGGVTGYFQNAWTQPLGISGGTVTKRWKDAWTNENPSKQLPRIVVNDTWNRQESSFWTCDMSWFKLKNLQLGYSFPQHISHQLFLQNLYVYLNATDLFTIVSDKYEGFDPERDTFSDGYGHYPIPRIYSIGVNITF